MTDDASRARMLGELRSLQRRDGAFRAEVELDADGSTCPDYNIFVTASVLRALRTISDRSLRYSLRGCRELALDYLFAARTVRGTSVRWPASDQPAWIPLWPERADDTALVTRLLLDAGRIDEREALEIMLTHVVTRRVPRDASRSPPWAAPGGYRTWIAPAAHPVALDATVNANVVGTLAMLGASGAPGYSEACALIRAAVGHAREAPGPLRTQITPYYPALAELDLAIAEAVELGADELFGLKPLVCSVGDVRDSPWIARAAHGRPRWRSRAVGIARELAVPSL